MCVDENGKVIMAATGESVFVKRDYSVIIIKKPHNEKQYQRIILRVTRYFLRNYYRERKQKNRSVNLKPFSTFVLKLVESVHIDSTFYSMIPDFDSRNKFPDGIMELKIREGLIVLIYIDRQFYVTLFDFMEPWKTDILDF